MTILLKIDRWQNDTLMPVFVDGKLCAYDVALIVGLLSCPLMVGIATASGTLKRNGLICLTSIIDYDDIAVLAC